MTTYASFMCLMRLIQKDLTRELRGRVAWPRMLLLGVVLVTVLVASINLPGEQQESAIGGMLWVTIFVSGVLALDQSFAAEHENGCWQTLLLYPFAPSLLFLAKLVTNVASLFILELFVIPLYVIETDVPFFARPGEMALILLLTNIGFSAAGTLVSGLTSGFRDRGGMLTLVLLPLVAPVLLSAVEATRIVLSNVHDPLWWWWIQLLGAFAVTFTTVGALAFGFVMEE